MPQEDPKPKAPMKIFVEAARATALAAHSSGSLMMSAAKLHPLRRVRLMEASRIVRQSEALARLAVSLLLAGDFDAPAPAEAPAASAATPTRRRRRGRRNNKNSQKKEDVVGVARSEDAGDELMPAAVPQSAGPSKATARGTRASATSPTPLSSTSGSSVEPAAPEHRHVASTVSPRKTQRTGEAAGRFDDVSVPRVPYELQERMRRAIATAPRSHVKAEDLPDHLLATALESIEEHIAGEDELQAYEAFAKALCTSSVD